LRILSVDYRFLPAHWSSGAGASKPVTPGTRLEPGDRLTVIISLADLQRFLTREKVPQDCAVEIHEVPEGARAWLADWLCSAQALSLDEAAKALDRLPHRLANHLTRGQAEGVLEVLRQNQVSGRIVQATT
jgi:hypothetical protein